MSLVINSLIKERYRIHAVLAQSGMGMVYQAYDETLNIEVAIKENRYTTEIHSRQFRNEATLLAGLRHPNLPRVIDHFVLPGQGEYLVMDLIAGQDLQQCLNGLGKPMVEDEVVRIGVTVCEALEYLHNRKPPIIHRDIKPANLKMTPEGQVVLVDFGLAKLFQQGERTTTGAEGSTAGYSPIEQYGQGVTDARSDIHALGATLYTLLTCEIPPESLTRAIGEDPLQPIAAFNQKVSPEVAAVIAKAMAIRPEDRYPSATALREALLAAHPHEVKPAVSPKTQTNARKRSIWAWLAPVLFVVIASIVALILLLGKSAKTVPVELTTATVTQANNNTEPIQTQEMPTPTETSPVIVILPTETLASTPEQLPQQQIAFVSERDGLPQIYLVNQDGTNLKALTRAAEGACQPEWSPDGSRLAYISPCRGLKERYDGSSIFVLTLSTGRSDLISTLATGDFDPAWSPDGSQLAFTSLQTGKPQIFIYSFETGQTQNLMNRSTISRMPAWSPDGSQIVFVAPSPATNQPILFLVDAAGQGEPQAILGQAYDRALRPVWSAANNLILFDMGSNGLLGWISRSGEQTMPLDTGLDIALTADISPDGQMIALCGAANGNALDIYLLPLQGGEATLLAPNPAADYQPAWRPQTAQSQ
ncbi:MAG: serine/threonine-protein kinase [Anaerolineaceae bacterium]|nr:serine/threonine-protein kinase [Anaerolineaceae bacterium]